MESVQEYECRFGHRSRNTKLLRHHCTLLFTMDIATQLYGSLAYDWVGKTWGNNNDPHSAILRPLFQVRTDLNWTEQFTLGPVPFFLKRQPLGAGKTGARRGRPHARYGAAFSRTFRSTIPTRRARSPSKSDFAVTFGAGVAGRFVRCAWRRIPHTVHWVRESRTATSFRGCAVGADVDANVILQFVMFKWTTKAWSGSWPTLADSWNMSVNNGDQYVLQRSELALGGIRLTRWMPASARPTTSRRAACHNLSHRPPSSPTPASCSHAPRLKATCRKCRVCRARLGSRRLRALSSRRMQKRRHGTDRHFVHALVEDDENAAPMYEYTYIGQATNAVADPNA